MADVRIHADCPTGPWLAALLGALTFGGALVHGQVPPVMAPPGYTSQATGPQGEAQPGAGTGQQEELVVDVRVVGNGQIPMEKILPHIKTRAGRPFDPELIEEDAHRLYGSQMFVSVRPLSQRVAGGRIVTFELLERPILHNITCIGNESIKKKTLEKEADIKPGDSLDTYAVEEAARRIETFYHGKGFSDARVSILAGNRPSDREAVFLINEGRKKRVLWTSFVGNTIASDARLRTQIKSKPGIGWYLNGEVKRDQIEEDIDRLTAYYRSLGFFRAEVGRELNFNESQTWLRLTFVINEGPRYVVRNVSFIGNNKFSDEELGGNLKLEAGQFFNQSQMGNDEAAIQERYGTIGHVFADVKTDLRFLEEPGQLDLVYQIDEGEVYRVGRITPTIKGEYPHTRIDTVLNRISLYPGDIIDIRELRASRRRLLSSQLFERDPSIAPPPEIVIRPPDPEVLEAKSSGGSQPQGQFRGQSPDPEPHGAYRPPTEPSQLDQYEDRLREALSRDADGAEGSRQGTEATVDERKPTGNRPPLVVRGQYSADTGLSVPALPVDPSRQPTPPYGNQYPAYSQPSYPGGIGRSGLLAPGNATINDLTPLLGLPPNQEPPLYVPLDPEVYETRTGRFMFSVGVNSDAGLLGSVIIDEQNFDWRRFPRSFQEIRDGIAWRGGGQRLRLEAVPGTQVQRYSINFQEPYLMNTNVSLGLSGYFYNRWYESWQEERLGGRIALGYMFAPDLSGTFSFRGAKVTLFDPIVGPGLSQDLDEALGESSLYGFRYQLAHDTRDNQFLTTEGHLIEMAIEYVIGSYQYPIGEVDLRKYFLLHQRPDGSGRHVLSVNGRMAISGDDTPIYEHQFAGGFSTIRGFDFRGASPTEGLLTVGGHFMLLSSVEYLFPITADNNLRGVVFCDTGTVEPSINDWTDKYRVAPGFGLRITVPAMGPAPIALDFAFPVSKEPTDETEVFSFFIGFLR